MCESISHRSLRGRCPKSTVDNLLSPVKKRKTSLTLFSVKRWLILSFSQDCLFWRSLTPLTIKRRKQISQADMPLILSRLSHSRPCRIFLPNRRSTRIDSHYAIMPSCTHPSHLHNLQLWMAQFTMITHQLTTHTFVQMIDNLITDLPPATVTSFVNSLTPYIVCLVHAGK